MCYLKALVLACLLVAVSSCSQSPTPAPTVRSPREGVINIPVVSSTAEIWCASRLWSQASQTATVVALSSKGRTSVTYFLDIGFEDNSSDALRDQFSQKLQSLGWTKGTESNEAYVADGRKLYIGFDTGMHPTTLIVRYDELKER